MRVVRKFLFIVASILAVIAGLALRQVMHHAAGPEPTQIERPHG